MLILKVMNGPLFGAELALPDEDCFIRLVDMSVRSVNTEVESGLDESASLAVLTIPFSGSSPNFTLKAVADPDGPAGLSAVVFDQERGMMTLDVVLNVPVFIGALRIAVRRADEVWSEAVMFDGGHAAADAPAPPQHAIRPARLGTVLGVALGALGFLAAMSLLWPFAVPAQNAVHLLAGVRATVVQGDAGVTYVIAPHADAANIARRTLQRADHGMRVQVLTQAEVIARIEQVLDEAGVRYFAVRLTEPTRPVLLLSTPLSAEVLQGLRDTLAYASRFEVLIRSEDDARRAARNLVGDLGVNAEFTTAPDRFVVSISDHMGDTQLDALGRSLDAYRMQWGERYVHFVINQRDLVKIDGIKTGGSSYELRGARHLFFQNPARLGGA